jgi:hypothetical protein
MTGPGIGDTVMTTKKLAGVGFHSQGIVSRILEDGRLVVKWKTLPWSNAEDAVDPRDLEVLSTGSSPSPSASSGGRT